MFAYIWEYQIDPRATETFEAVYGPEGEWIQLFSKSRKYLKTELLKDQSTPNRYLTIDYWASREDLSKFRETYSREYARLDKICDALTVSEKQIGEFSLQLPMP